MQSRPIFRAILAALLIVAGGASAQPVKFAPVDEAAGDVSWTRFRTRLIDALIKHDQKFVMGIVERNVRNISGNDGVAEFRKLWEPNDPESPLWSELPKLLFLGSAVIKQNKLSEVCAPYVYFRWPDNAPDAANAAIIAREALVKARPTASSATVQTLSYELVTVSDWEVIDDNKDGKQIWIAVKIPGGAGYLPQELARSPLEYRACFVKRDGSWRLSGLEVGE